MATITTTGESWNNHSFSEVETHLKGYYSKTGHTHSYLPTSGGAMSGTLTIHSSDSWGEGIRIQQGGQSDVAAIFLYDYMDSTKETQPHNGFALVSIGSQRHIHTYVNHTEYQIDIPTKNGTMALTNDFKTINGNSIIGSGDITIGGGGGGNYLPLGGGNMTGAINFSQMSGGSSTITFKNGEYFDTYANVYLGSSSSSWNVFSNTSTTLLSVDTQGAISIASGINFLTNGEKLDEYGNLHFSEESGAWNIFNANGTALFRVITSNGSVGIGVITPSYKLHVVGDVYATGGVTAASDARLKDVQGDTTLTIEDIANAPSVKFLWKNDHSLGMQAGTLAQYWQGVLPEVVSDKGGELGLQYGVAALISSITTAKKVVNHEERIKQLEDELAKLKAEKS